MPQALPFVPTIIGAGASIIGANKNAHAMKSAAKQATPVPYSIFGPAGGFAVDPKTKQLSLTQGQNPFADLLKQLGMGGFEGAMGLTPETEQAYQGLFGQGLTDRIQGNYDLLSQLAAPGERRAGLALDDTLFSRGQLGTTGGAERFRALQEALGQNDLQRQLQAIGLGRSEAQTRFGGAMDLQGRQLDIGSGGFGAFQSLFDQLLKQASLGLGAMSGTPPNIAAASADASGGPFRAAFSALQQAGAFAPGAGGGGAPPSMGVPMLPQPNLGAISVSPPSFFPMPQVPGL